MINITDKSKCCGCNACVQRCPKSCISMCMDKEGFWYPVVNHSDCIDCGLCEKVCPFLDTAVPGIPLKSYATKNNNTGQQLNASSGGIFIVLANYVISRGGVVFGAAFDKSWNVVHTFAEQHSELVRFIGSKYVQSNIGQSFRTAEKFLRADRTVLFSGTPCQVKGLRKYLRQDYPNLITVEIVCHGVPSPYVWDKYKSEFIANENISAINFRAKQPFGYDWKKYGFTVSGSEGKLIYSNYARSTVFFKLFLTDLVSRPSCYSCNAKNGSSGADITLGDFWGIESVIPDYYDDKGISLMFLHSKKSLDILERVNGLLDRRETTFTDAVSHNPSYIKSVPEPKERVKFWKDFLKTDNLDHALHKAVYKPNIVLVSKAILNKILSVIRIHK